MEEHKSFLHLLQGYLQHQLSKQDEDLFFDLLLEPANQAILEQAVDLRLQQTELTGPSIAEHRLQDMEDRILSSVPQGKLLRMTWQRWASVAAIALLVLGTALYLRFSNEKQVNPEILSIETTAALIKAPEANQAYITLADGRMLDVDSLQGMSLAEGAAMLGADGDGIRYSGAAGEREEPKEQEIQWNTLTNPRGSKVISIVLADGTKVWLNAGSSMTYPVVFGKEKREIGLQGEGYLEVAHDTKKPFFVRKGDFLVQVLGTKFNFSAYDDDEDMRVALVEGSVRVSTSDSDAAGHSGILKPGQQAAVRKGGEKLKISQAQLGQVLAWREGRFDFEDLDFQEAMRQVERWYGIDIKYIGAPPDIIFSGDLDRNTSLAGVVKLLRGLNLELDLKDKVLTIAVN